ncbi:MAG: IS1 family transposase [Clostridia bacterium]|nr:IS1 family transposase [Clostridia bacterium]
MGLKDKFIRFMYGRYGADELYRFLTIVFYVLFFLNLFIGSYILSAFIIALLVFMTYRVFSKNIMARRAENEKYLAIKRSFKGFMKLQKNKWRDRKTHVYKKCPHCGAVLRFPKRRGEHSAVCPSCKRDFNVKV